MDSKVREEAFIAVTMRGDVRDWRLAWTPVLGGAARMIGLWADLRCLQQRSRRRHRSSRVSTSSVRVLVADGGKWDSRRGGARERKDRNILRGDVFHGARTERRGGGRKTAESEDGGV